MENSVRTLQSCDSHEASDDQVTSSKGASPLRYQFGFGNNLASEAVPGTLPIGQNCIKVPAHGLIHEVVNATAFTAPRAHNLRCHLYRIRPSTTLPEVGPRENGLWLSAPLAGPIEPNAIRWAPFELPTQAQDFVDGIMTLCANGSAIARSGMAMHVYIANRSMQDKVFSNADGEMLIIPQLGSLRIMTELGMLEVRPGELAIIPRGCKMRVELVDAQARGWMCENYGVPMQLPELGLLGSQGQANPWDFEVPVAAYEDREVETLVVHKIGGEMWETMMDHSPFDVIGWRGNWMPVKFDMAKFMVAGAVAFDHSDPSIYCALTSPGHPVGGANIDFMIMPPRWLVAEHTFRPAATHRNDVAEFLGVISDEAGPAGTKIPAGGSTLHNCWAPHGPDADLVDYARNGDDDPVRFERLFFLVESREPFKLTAAGRETPARVRDYYDTWSGFKNKFRATQAG